MCEEMQSETVGKDVCIVRGKKCDDDVGINKDEKNKNFVNENKVRCLKCGKCVHIFSSTNSYARNLK